MQNQISDIKRKLLENNTDITKYEISICESHNYIKLLSIQKQKYNKIIILLNKIEFDMNIYEHIIKLINPKGIPRIIINHKLECVENQVNYIIFPFINKKIIIAKEIDDIKVMLSDSISKYNFGGGMESFIVMLAFKIAFSSVFNIPTSGILFIDEGVSVLDKNHISKFNIIASFLKQYYNHIILITHIDSFSDYTVDNIMISKKNKISYVTY